MTPAPHGANVNSINSQKKNLQNFEANKLHKSELPGSIWPVAMLVFPSGKAEKWVMTTSWRMTSHMMRASPWLGTAIAPGFFVFVLVKIIFLELISCPLPPTRGEIFSSCSWCGVPVLLACLPHMHATPIALVAFLIPVAKCRVRIWILSLQAFSFNLSRILQWLLSPKRESQQRCFLSSQQRCSEGALNGLAKQQKQESSSKMQLPRFQKEPQNGPFAGASETAKLLSGSFVYFLVLLLASCFLLLVSCVFFFFLLASFLLLPLAFFFHILLALAACFLLPYLECFHILFALASCLLASCFSLFFLAV